MNYEVRILRAAEREMDALSAALHRRISQRILSFEENPRQRGSRKLSGREEYRMRVGDYRILYAIDDDERVVTIVAVGHRREVYR